jgi:transcriptional regulator with XRE-family HTH domain
MLYCKGKKEHWIIMARNEGKAQRNRPITQELEAPLSRRLAQLRNLRNLTLQDLSSRCHFPVSRLEDLESGLETWLSASDRQLLAMALAVEPHLLQEVEERPRLSPIKDPKRYQAMINEITVSILQGARELACPQCGHILRCRIQEAYDIHENPVRDAKAFCQKCPFTL